MLHPSGLRPINITIFYLNYLFKWRRKWQPIPVLLPGKSHGQKSLVGHGSPWGCKELDTTEQLHFTHFILYHWRRKWQPTPVFLPGESHGQGSLAGRGPCSHRESDMTEVTQQERRYPTIQHAHHQKFSFHLYGNSPHSWSPLSISLTSSSTLFYVMYLSHISFNTLNLTGAIGSIKRAFKIIILKVLSLDWDWLNLMIICHPRRNDL